MVNALCLVIGGAEECTEHPEKSYNEHRFKGVAALFAFVIAGDVYILAAFSNLYVGMNKA